MLQHDASLYIISIRLYYGHCQHSCCNMIYHRTSSPSCYIMAIVSNHTATLWPLQAFMQQHDASLYIISIIQHYGKRKQSCCNMMHHPTSSASCYFIATVSIHAATWSIIVHHLHYPTLWPLSAIILQHYPSVYIISIIQHYGNNKQSYCNMMHHPTSSLSSNIMAITQHS